MDLLQGLSLSHLSRRSQKAHNTRTTKVAPTSKSGRCASILCFNEELYYICSCFQLQMHNMESARGSSSTTSSSNSSTNSSSSSDYTRSSGQTSSVLDVPYSDSDSDIEREIRGSTDEITVPLTVCVFVMVR